MHDHYVDPLDEVPENPTLRDVLIRQVLFERKVEPVIHFYIQISAVIRLGAWGIGAGGLATAALLVTGVF